MYFVSGFGCSQSEDVMQLLLCIVSLSGGGGGGGWARLSLHWPVPKLHHTIISENLMESLNWFTELRYNNIRNYFKNIYIYLSEVLTHTCELIIEETI